jgi:DNA repair protein RadC
MSKASSPKPQENAPQGDARQADMQCEDTPHYHGHRERLRDRFRKAGEDALADYELLELVLFRAMPRRDVKPIAKALIARFGSFAEAIAARPERLAEIPHLGEASITELKLVEAAARRLTKAAITKRPSMGSFSAVVDYCHYRYGFQRSRTIPHSLSR